MQNIFAGIKISQISKKFINICKNLSKITRKISKNKKMCHSDVYFVAKYPLFGYF